jgi:thiol-disulfide isomerase/thioredoxin
MGVSATVGQAQDKKIEMTAVNYDGLKQEVLKQRGKVVLVDFWATFCPPCKKAFPHFIEMQKKYADKGFVVLSVSLDEAATPEKVALANTFLRKVDSPFRNLLLDEPQEVWSKKMGFKSIPCYFVFDRHGKWVRFRASDSADGVDYDQVEKTIVQMLNEK